MSNSIKHMKIISVMAKWVNPRWPPKWPPRQTSKSIYGHNFCSRAYSLMKLVAKYRFSYMSNSIKYIRITSDMSRWVNPRWPPTWQPRQTQKL